MKLTQEEKQDLLNKNTSFCMLPWVSMHVTPTGVGTPCCIGNQLYPVGNANEKSLMELVNRMSILHCGALIVSMMLLASVESVTWPNMSNTICRWA